MPLITTPKQYRELHGKEQLAKWDIVKQIIAPNPAEFLLDVGSGPVAWWKGWHDNTITIDPFFKPPGKFPVKACAEYIPLQSQSVSYTVTISSIHLCMPVEFALREIARVTSKVAVITVLKHSRHLGDFKKLIPSFFFTEKIIDQGVDLFYILTPRIW